MKFSIIVILVFVTGVTLAQNPTQKVDSVDWRTVQIRVFKSRNTPITLKEISEWEFDSIHAKKLEVLTPENIELIKKTVAASGSTVAYLDLKGYFANPQFPSKGLYVLGLKRRK